MNLQTQLEFLKQQASQSMMAADSPSIENPNYYQDTKPQYLRESQDLYCQHDNHHQYGSMEIEPNSDLNAIMTSYSEVDQHLNTCNQCHHGGNNLLPESFGYISYSKYEYKGDINQYN